MSRFDFSRIKVVLIRERWTIFKFLLVGGSSFLVKAGSYALLSRLVWPQGSHTVENAIAIVLALAYNYILHRVWTFGHLPMAKGALTRYLLVSIFSGVLDAGLFYLLHTVFGFYDLLVLAFNSFAIAFLTFFFHRLFTFHEDPWKRRKT